MRQSQDAPLAARSGLNGCRARGGDPWLSKQCHRCRAAKTLGSRLGTQQPERAAKRHWQCNPQPGF
eukprot:12923597-Prorocentrum_lima.AAC.1